MPSSHRYTDPSRPLRLAHEQIRQLEFVLDQRDVEIDHLKMDLYQSTVEADAMYDRAWKAEAAVGEAEAARKDPTPPDCPKFLTHYVDMGKITSFEIEGLQTTMVYTTAVAYAKMHFPFLGNSHLAGQILPSTQFPGWWAQFCSTESWEPGTCAGSSWDVRGQRVLVVRLWWRPNLQTSGRDETIALFEEKVRSDATCKDLKSTRDFYSRKHKTLLAQFHQLQFDRNLAQQKVNEAQIRTEKISEQLAVFVEREKERVRAARDVPPSEREEHQQLVAKQAWEIWELQEKLKLHDEKKMTSATSFFRNRADTLEIKLKSSQEAFVIMRSEKDRALAKQKELEQANGMLWQELLRERRENLAPALAPAMAARPNDAPEMPRVVRQAAEGAPDVAEAKPSPVVTTERHYKWNGKSLKVPEDNFLVSSNVNPLLPPPRWGKAFPVHIGGNCHHVCLDLNRLPGLFFGEVKKYSKRKSAVFKVIHERIIKAATDVHESREAALKLMGLEEAPYAELPSPCSSSNSASSWEEDVWTKDAEGAEGPVLQDNRAKTPSSES